MIHLENQTIKLKQETLIWHKQQKKILKICNEEFLFTPELYQQKYLLLLCLSFKRHFYTRKNTNTVSPHNSNCTSQYL